MTPDQTADDVDVTPEDVESRTAAESMNAEPFVKLTTPGAKMKIITALLRVHGEKLNMSGICGRAGIHHDTWYAHRDDLLDFGVIEEAEAAGNSPMYRVEFEDAELVDVGKRNDRSNEYALSETGRQLVKERTEWEQGAL